MSKLLGWTTELIEIPCSCAIPCGWVHREATGRRVITMVLDPGDPDPKDEWVTPRYCDQNPFVLPFLNNTIDEEFVNART